MVVKQSDQALAESIEFLQAVFDSFDSSAVILDHRGYIVLVNQAWIDFGRANGLAESWEWVGLDYLEFCQDPAVFGSEAAAKAYDAVTAVLSGREGYVEYEYACHSPGREQWLQRSVRELTYAGQPWVLIVETEITEREQVERTLYECEQVFRTTFEQAAVGIAHVAPDGRFLRLNQRFCDLIGYSLEEMLALHFQDISYPEDLSIDLEHAQQLLDGEVEIYQVEHRYIRGDDEIMWINLTASLLRKATGEPDYFIVVVKDVTERKRAEAALQAYQQQLKSLATQLTLAEEEERRRLAADLHDGVSQTLAFARIQLAAARKAAGPEVMAILDDVSDTLRGTIQDIRDLIFDLSSPLLNEIGLTAALAEWLEERMERQHGLRTELINAAPDIELDENVRIILFRSLRELLTNVVRHAQATKVRVRLERSDELLIVVVEDDGVGFDPLMATKPTNRSSGFGLFSIQERMFDLGGRLEIKSEPDQGCTAILEVPLNIG